MAKKILFTVVLSTLLFSYGCGPKFVKTKLDKVYEKGFSNLQVPGIEKIKTEGISKEYPYATFDEVWDASIIVLMQLGFIARLSKEAGMIVVVPPQQTKREKDLLGVFHYCSIGHPPLFNPVALIIEEKTNIKVYFKFTENLNRKADNPEDKVEVPLDENRVAEAFFAMLTNQLYADKKWRYLFKESTQ